MIFRSIEAIAEIGGMLRVLDLTRAAVRKATIEAKSAKDLYEGGLAGDYR